MRKLMMMLLAIFPVLGVFAAPPQSAGTGTEASVSQKALSEDRVSGTIARSNKDKSTLVVKEQRSEIERTVFYNDSTKWTKGKETADMKEFKDGARVICLGKLNEKGELAATRIDLQP
jgi:hypothetical protein